MACPWDADRGTVSKMDGSCEYTEYAEADSRQGEVLQLGGWAKCYQLLTVKTGLGTKRISSIINLTDREAEQSFRRKYQNPYRWHCRRIASSGRADETLKANIKQSKISEISNWHTKADSFQTDRQTF